MSRRKKNMFYDYNYELGKFVCGDREMGHLSVTQAVYRKMSDDKSFSNFISHSLMRYQRCDWGDISSADYLSNEKALKEGKSIIAAYNFGQLLKKSSNEECDRILIITEDDRSYTTISFPNEKFFNAYYINQYKNRCNDCHHAHMNTCSGARAKTCREKELQKLQQNLT